MYFFPNLEPVYCSMSVRTVASWHAHKISQKAGKVVWYSHLFKNFPLFVVIHTVKGFVIIKKVVDVFLVLSCFSNDPTDFGNLISGSSAFSKSSLNVWKFSIHTLLKPSLENVDHYYASMWDVALPFMGTGNENWPFPVLWTLLSFPNLLVYQVQHFHSIIF